MLTSHSSWGEWFPPRHGGSHTSPLTFSPWWHPLRYGVRGQSSRPPEWSLTALTSLLTPSLLSHPPTDLFLRPPSPALHGTFPSRYSSWICFCHDFSDILKSSVLLFPFPVFSIALFFFPSFVSLLLFYLWQDKDNSCSAENRPWEAKLTLISWNLFH